MDQESEFYQMLLEHFDNLDGGETWCVEDIIGEIKDVFIEFLRKQKDNMKDSA